MKFIVIFFNGFEDEAICGEDDEPIFFDTEDEAKDAASDLFGVEPSLQYKVKRVYV